MATLAGRAAQRWLVLASGAALEPSTPPRLLGLHERLGSLLELGEELLLTLFYMPRAKCSEYTSGVVLGCYGLGPPFFLSK